MDSKDRHDRDSHTQVRGKTDRDSANTRKRRRSPSPGREQRNVRHEGERRDVKQRTDRGQNGKTKLDEGHDHNRRTQQVRGDKAHHSKQNTAADVSQPQASQLRASETSAGLLRGKVEGGSSMPFIRNDKPFQYGFEDDDDIVLAQEVGDMPDDATLRKWMGFAKFRTSHELKIPDNVHNHGIYTVKQSKYRQYMNRRDGFNRPLSPSHD